MAFIGMIITLVLILVAFFGPWYGGESNSVESYASLTEWTMKGGGMETTMKISEMGDDDVEGVFNNTYYMSIAALIFAILALIGTLGLFFNFGPANTMKWLAFTFGMLTFIFALIAALYFMAALPGATDTGEGFWNDNTGPAYGWYLMLVAGIIGLVFSLPLLKKEAA